MEAGGLKLREVEGGEVRARGYGALAVCVVLCSADGRDGLAVSVGDVEDGAGDVGPAPDGAGARAVVGAIGGAAIEQVEDCRGHVSREGEAAQLVVHNGDAIQRIGRVGHTVAEGAHGPHEVAPVADHPGAAHDVVPGTASHG